MVKKLTFGLGALIFIVMVLCGATYYYFIRLPLPQVSGEIQVTGLNGPVKVLRDRWGVPHIYANGVHDLLFAQGFVQAQDRLWQMEANRRLASGRLSEVVGEKTIELDRWMRTLGLMRAAERDVAASGAKARDLLQAFADGVNAYMERRKGRLPIEFRLLGIEPEPWRPADSIAWTKMMAFSGGKNWQEEVVRAMMIQSLGKERFESLWGLNRPGTPTIVPEGLRLSSLWPMKPDGNSPCPWAVGGASNNWTVHGSRTDTGLPILANDMHLPVGIPCIWYEMHLSGGGFDAAGLTLPGVPLIIAGHNQHLAWGITFAMTDCQDVFLEKLDPDHEGRWLYKGQWREMNRIRETIRVKGRKTPVVLDVWETRHGPIITAQAPEARLGEYALALRWSGHDPGEMAETLRGMNLARNWAEFAAAAKRWSEPAANLVYADREGNIGYVLGSRVPIRAGGHGMGPFEGWTGENEWLGYLDPGEKLSFLNPDQGFAVTANNRVAGPEYPYYLSGDYMYGFRAARIADMLEKGGTISLNAMGRLQGDLKCLEAERVISALDGIEVSGPEARELLSRLRSWDCVLGTESTEGAIYSVFFYRLLENTFRDELGDLADRFFGVGLIPTAPMNLFVEHSRAILMNMLREPNNAWFDNVGTPKRETLADQLEKSLAETAAFITKELGPDMAKWRWGCLHKAEIKHPLGRVKPLDRLFNLGPFEVGGHFSTVWQTSIMPGMDFRLEGWTASNRNVYDLQHWDRSLAAIIPGQSGMVGSSHYGDQMEMWLKVGHHPLYYSKASVESAAKEVLTLTP
jgi:penicillin amidase